MATQSKKAAARRKTAEEKKEKAAKEKAAKTRGRPAGSPNHAVEHGEATLSRCKCGSTSRGEYFARVERKQTGVDSAGKSYTHIVWRRCKCNACGQYRVDRTYENRPETEPLSPADPPSVDTAVADTKADEPQANQPEAEGEPESDQPKADDPEGDQPEPDEKK